MLGISSPIISTAITAVQYITFSEHFYIFD